MLRDVSTGFSRRLETKWKFIADSDLDAVCGRAAQAASAHSAVCRVATHAVVMELGREAHRCTSEECAPLEVGEEGVRQPHANRDLPGFDRAYAVL